MLHELLVTPLLSYKRSLGANKQRGFFDGNRAKAYKQRHMKTKRDFGLARSLRPPPTQGLVIMSM